MRRTVRKLIIGKGTSPNDSYQHTIRQRWANLVAIWNNTYEEDAGLEKLVRLVLAASQFLFPGVYIKHMFWRNGRLYQDFAVEVFVLFKAALPVLVLSQGWERQPMAIAVVLWFMLETVMYIPTLIFASDTFDSPRSYRRSKLLVFINYLEVVFSFAVIHAAGGYFNQPLAHWTDAVYISFVITSTIGFGEYYPITGVGKLMVSLQSLFYLSYFALFISMFNSGSDKGYFKGSGRR
ncbi:MAG: two pore domain potassium channel family protein [Flavobacteriales bacterium]|nr:two pore domain potassium channel family protein [Flavobacteriales bacterium]